MPWGKVDTDVFAAWGQWAGGIGSILAVIVAFAVLARDRRIHHRAMEKAAQQDHEDRERERAEEEARQIGHARTVVGAYVDTETVVMDLPGEQSLRLVHGVRIGNYGTRPVLEVVLESVTFQAYNHGLYDKWSVSPPHRFASSAPLTKRFRASDLLAPNEHVELINLRFEGLDRQMSGLGTVEVTFSFLDAEGVRWRRVGSSVPVRIADDDDDVM